MASAAFIVKLDKFILYSILNQLCFVGSIATNGGPSLKIRKNVVSERSNCLKFSLLSFCLLFFQLSYGQYNFSALDSKLQEQRKLLGENLVVIIAHKDSILFQKQLGDFNAKTVAPIASCSKWLTAALVMQAVDEGKLSLDDKVSQFLPVFEKYGKSYITIRHCLSHMTGIQTDGGRLAKLLERKSSARWMKRLLLLPQRRSRTILVKHSVTVIWV
jgi:hypothetical protein